MKRGGNLGDTDALWSNALDVEALMISLAAAAAARPSRQPEGVSDPSRPTSSGSRSGGSSVSGTTGSHSTGGTAATHSWQGAASEASRGAQPLMASDSRAAGLQDASAMLAFGCSQPSWQELASTGSDLGPGLAPAFASAAQGQGSRSTAAFPQPPPRPDSVGGPSLRQQLIRQLQWDVQRDERELQARGSRSEEPLPPDWQLASLPACPPAAPALPQQPALASLSSAAARPSLRAPAGAAGAEQPLPPGASPHGLREGASLAGGADAQLSAAEATLRPISIQAASGLFPLRPPSAEETPAGAALLAPAAAAQRLSDLAAAEEWAGGVVAGAALPMREQEGAGALESTEAQLAAVERALRELQGSAADAQWGGLQLEGRGAAGAAAGREERSGSGSGGPLEAAGGVELMFQQQALQLLPLAPRGRPQGGALPGDHQAAQLEALLQQVQRRMGAQREGGQGEAQGRPPTSEVLDHDKWLWQALQLVGQVGPRQAEALRPLAPLWGAGESLRIDGAALRGEGTGSFAGHALQSPPSSAPLPFPPAPSSSGLHWPPQPRPGLEARLMALAAAGSAPSGPPLLPLPRGVRPSPEALRASGHSERPLEMMVVRSLTMALAEAVAAADMAAFHSLHPQLQAAGCPTGSAPQRIAHFFAGCLATRVAGDGLRRYTSEVPSEADGFEAAWSHYVHNTPFGHFFDVCIVLSILHALDREAERVAGALPRGQRPSEHLHLVSLSVEGSYLLLILLNILAQRPQGAPARLHITMVDSMPAEIAPDALLGRAQQMKEQLAVQAVMAGVEEFACDVVVGAPEELPEGLAAVPLSAARREQMRRAQEEQAGGRHGGKEGGQRGGAKRATLHAGKGSSKPPSAGPAAPQRGTAAATGGNGGSQAGKKPRVGQGAHAGSSDAVGKEVDVLAVWGILAAHNYSDEAAGGRASPRDCVLSWAASLCPEALLLAEFNFDASGPFLAARVRESFDLLATFAIYHDLMCSPHRVLPGAPGSRAPRREEASGAAGAGASAAYLVDSADEGQGSQATMAFRIYLPESRLRRALTERSLAASDWRQPLDPLKTWAFEKWFFFRAHLNIIALDGRVRLVRPWSHKHWRRVMLQHGFREAPFVGQVAQEVSGSMRSHLPDFVAITPTKDGLAFAICGRDVIRVSLWSRP